jgi:hypothetical protein
VSTEIPVTWPLPDNTRPPGITGNAVPGGTLTADPGDWHLKYPEQPGPITFGYYWSLNGIGGPFTSGSTFKASSRLGGENCHSLLRGKCPRRCGWAHRIPGSLAN